MLPDNVKTRRVPRVTFDEDGVELSRKIEDIPAPYAWKLTHKTSGEVTWVNADEERSHRILKKLFEGREENVRATHTVEKIGADGRRRWGPGEI